MCSDSDADINQDAVDQSTIIYQTPVPNVEDSDHFIDAVQDTDIES